MPLQVKYHYIPCFWSAFWNEDYYHRFLSSQVAKARSQRVECLNLRADKLFTTTVENVFYEKHVGLADLKNEEVLEFAKRYFPDETLEFDPSDSGEYFLDFENFFSTQEELQKETLFEVIQTQEIANLKQKTEIAFFILDLQFRNHTKLNAMIGEYTRNGRPKFEFFWMTKQMFSDTTFLTWQVMPLVCSGWTIYQLEKFEFPLGDNPVIVTGNEMLIPLSPCLLLRIDRRIKIDPRLLGEKKTEICVHKKGIDTRLSTRYRHLAILNSSREIIFGDRDVLLRWKQSSVYRKHRVSL